MAKGFKKKNKKGGHDFIPTDKKTVRSSEPDTKINIEINNESEEFSEGVRKDFASKNTDEHGITLDVIKELQELEKDKEISIEEVNDGFNTVSGVGKYLTLSNGATYNLFSNYDEMEEEAKARIRQDLDEPEMFNQDFLDSHMSISETDARLFGNDFGDMMVEDRDIDELKEMADEMGISYDDPAFHEDDDGITKEKLKEIEENMKNELIDKISYERSKEVEKTILENGLRSFICDDEGLCSDDEFMEQYGKWLRVDYDSAIRDAIASDGVEHFVSGYDGESHETKDGQYLVKHND